MAYQFYTTRRITRTWLYPAPSRLVRLFGTKGDAEIFHGRDVFSDITGGYYGYSRYTGVTYLVCQKKDKSVMSGFFYRRPNSCVFKGFLDGKVIDNFQAGVGLVKTDYDGKGPMGGPKRVRANYSYIIREKDSIQDYELDKTYSLMQKEVIQFKNVISKLREDSVPHDDQNTKRILKEVSRSLLLHPLGPTPPDEKIEVLKDLDEMPQVNPLEITRYKFKYRSFGPTSFEKILTEMSWEVYDPGLSLHLELTHIAGADIDERRKANHYGLKNSCVMNPNSMYRNMKSYFDSEDFETGEDDEEEEKQAEIDFIQCSWYSGMDCYEQKNEETEQHSGSNANMSPWFKYSYLGKNLGDGKLFRRAMAEKIQRGENLRAHESLETRQYRETIYEVREMFIMSTANPLETYTWLGKPRDDMEILTVKWMESLDITIVPGWYWKFEKYGKDQPTPKDVLNAHPLEDLDSDDEEDEIIMNYRRNFQDFGKYHTIQPFRVSGFDGKFVHNSNCYLFDFDEGKEHGVMYWGVTFDRDEYRLNKNPQIPFRGCVISMNGYGSTKLFRKGNGSDVLIDPFYDRLWYAPEVDVLDDNSVFSERPQDIDLKGAISIAKVNRPPTPFNFCK